MGAMTPLAIRCAPCRRPGRGAARGGVARARGVGRRLAGAAAGGGPAALRLRRAVGGPAACYSGPAEGWAAVLAAAVLAVATQRRHDNAPRPPRAPAPALRTITGGIPLSQAVFVITLMKGWSFAAPLPLPFVRFAPTGSATARTATDAAGDGRFELPPTRRLLR
jgi:hypothetical protein